MTNKKNRLMCNCVSNMSKSKDVCFYMYYYLGKLTLVSCFTLKILCVSEKTACLQNDVKFEINFN